MDYPTLKIKSSDPKGRGVFTTSAISRYDEVLEFKGELIRASEAEDLTHCLQIDDDLFLAPTGGIDDLINHSCDPCCGVTLTEDKRVVLFAFRDIGVEEEITFDYATAQSGEHEVLICRCVSPNCRKKISGFRDLPEELQHYYIKERAVLPFLVK